MGLLILFGIGAISLSVIITPSFTSKFLSPDHNLSAESVQLLNRFRFFSFISGILAIIYGFVLLIVKNLGKKVDWVISFFHLEKLPELPQLKRTLSSKKEILIAVFILIIWLLVVIFTATKHEFWRDEVRAFTQARAAITVFDLYEITQYDGHPVLWFLILFFGKTISNTPLVLPIASILIAFSAVSIFMFFSPFQLWIKCLFIFSGLPLYEYSVLARDYGLSMLLLFISAILYRNKEKHTFLLAFALFLLANSNAHSTILVCLIALIWLWDLVANQRKLSNHKHKISSYLPFVLIFAGLLLSLFWIFPKTNAKLSPIDNLSFKELLVSVSAATFDAFIKPGQTFSALLPFPLPPLVASIMIYLSVFGLLARTDLFLAAFSSLIAFGLFFRVIYDGHYRHQGLFFIFIIFLFWLFIDSLSYISLNRGKKLLFFIGFYGAFLILIIGNVALAYRSVKTDIFQEMSSSSSLGKFLNNSTIYRNAIIVAEPDYFMESLPYYSDNLIYFPREDRFGEFVTWTSESKKRLSLSEVLSTALTIKAKQNQPVLIVLGHLSIGNKQDGAITYSYNNLFTWNRDELEDFNKNTSLVAEFTSSKGNENYRVYEIK